MIAEYERAKILKRGRPPTCRTIWGQCTNRGPPSGIATRAELTAVARFEVIEAEAHIVRLIFAWVGLDRMSLRAVCRRLQQMGCRTRQGSTCWQASTIRGMLDNPTYIGRAAFGRGRFLPPSAATATNLWASEALAAGHRARPHATRRVDRDSTSSHR